MGLKFAKTPANILIYSFGPNAKYNVGIAKFEAGLGLWLVLE
jgi:hypothetical protein